MASRYTGMGRSKEETLSHMVFGALDPYDKANGVRVSRCGRFLGVVDTDGVKTVPMVAVAPNGVVLAPFEMVKGTGDFGMKTFQRDTVFLRWVVVKDLRGRTREEVFGSDIKVYTRSSDEALKWLLGEG